MGQVRRARSFVLDASALTEAADNRSHLRTQLQRATRKGAQAYTTAAALAEVLRGHPRDVLINRLLDSMQIEVVDASRGRRAGERIGRTLTRGNVTLDAIVAEIASTLPKPVVVLTSDPKDLTALVDPDVMVLNIAA